MPAAVDPSVGSTVVAAAAVVVVVEEVAVVPHSEGSTAAAAAAVAAAAVVEEGEYFEEPIVAVVAVRRTETSIVAAVPHFERTTVAAEEDIGKETIVAAVHHIAASIVAVVHRFGASTASMVAVVLEVGLETPIALLAAGKVADPIDSEHAFAVAAEGAANHQSLVFQELRRRHHLGRYVVTTVQVEQVSALLQKHDEKLLARYSPPFDHLKTGPRQTSFVFHEIHMYLQKDREVAWLLHLYWYPLTALVGLERR